MQGNESLSNHLKSITMLDFQTVEIVYLDNVSVDSEAVKEIYHVLDEFTGGRRLKKLLIIGHHVVITKDARIMIVQENDKRKDAIIAEAVVVNSFAQKLSANFYIMFLQKIYPTHFFTDVNEAKEWLGTH